MSVMERDEIVAIEPKREKFFGGPGRMLLPCPATVGELVAKIPAGQVATTKELKATLAERFDVRGVCPVTFRDSLYALTATDAPYWRVVKPTGELIARFPDQADRLRQEGLPVETNGKLIKLTTLSKNGDF